MQLLKSKIGLEEFIPHVQAHALGSDNDSMLPDNAAKSFVRNSAIKFAEKSGFLKETIFVDLQCGQTKYPIESLDGETIIGIKKAKLGDFETCDCSGFHWNWGGIDFRFCDDILEIYPAPTKDIPQGLEVEIVIAPCRDACEIDYQFYSKWFDAVINGALAEIHLMPNQPWSSVSRHDTRQRAFNEDVGRASVRRVLEGRREPLQAQMNSDFITCKTSQRRW